MFTIICSNSSITDLIPNTVTKRPLVSSFPPHNTIFDLIEKFHPALKAGREMDQKFDQDIYDEEGQGDQHKDSQPASVETKSS